jgi:hypothetical protein
MSHSLDTPQSMPMMPVPMFYSHPSAYPMPYGGPNPYMMMQPPMSTDLHPSSKTTDRDSTEPSQTSSRTGTSSESTGTTNRAGPVTPPQPVMPGPMPPIPYAYPYPYSFYHPSMMPMMVQPQMPYAFPNSVSQVDMTSPNHYPMPSKGHGEPSNWSLSSRGQPVSPGLSPRTHSPSNSLRSSPPPDPPSSPPSPTAVSSALLSLASAASSARAGHLGGASFVKRAAHRPPYPVPPPSLPPKPRDVGALAKPRTHQCSVCLKHFTRRSNLVAHIDCGKN